MPSPTPNDMNESEASAADRNELLAPPEEVDVCPSIYFPPNRLHERFGMCEGRPIVEDDTYGRPPRHLPEAPFGGSGPWLDEERWRAVLVVPGYHPRPNEALWLVKMWPRYACREMVCDAACGQLYPHRFLRRFVEIGMAPNACQSPLLACLFGFVHVSYYLYVGAGDLHVPRCDCLGLEIPEAEKEIQEDYERRFYAFNERDTSCPCTGAFRGWPDRRLYRGPHLRLVLEVCRCTAEAE
ncbi:hypothetical protein Emed_003666 [Eimeria media]